MVGKGTSSSTSLLFQDVTMIFHPSDNNFQVVGVNGRQRNLLFNFFPPLVCKSSLHGDVVLIRRLERDTGVQHLLQHCALPCHRLQNLHLKPIARHKSKQGHVTNSEISCRSESSNK